MDKVEKMFTDTRGIFRSLKSEKGRQYSDKQKGGKETNSVPQNTKFNTLIQRSGSETVIKR
jgi:hypothetical protein